MIRAILLIALVIGAYAYASNNDYKAAQMEHIHDCEMIHAGAWPLNVDPACGYKK